uniref:Transmembrane protein 100 n=1 Tax=Salvator merianae TaxID=96440 RepID=A0A8D0B5V1_SALMN
ASMIPTKLCCLVTLKLSLTRTLDPRLISTTTGGVEASCANCMLPLGLVLGIIGLAATGVACANDRPGSVLSVMGWTLLATAVLCVAASWLWWYYRKRKKCGSSQTANVVDK